MNLDRRENIRYVEGQNLDRHLKSPKFKRMEVYDDIYEIVKKKCKITDSIPIHCAVTILSNAKLLMLKFIRDMRNNLNFQKLSLLYMGRFKLEFKILTTYRY